MTRVIKPFDAQPFPRPLRPDVTEGGDVIPQPARTGEELLPPADYVPAPYVDVDPRGVMPTGYPTNTRPTNPNPNPKAY